MLQALEMFPTQRLHVYFPFTAGYCIYAPILHIGVSYSVRTYTPNGNYILDNLYLWYNPMLMMLPCNIYGVKITAVYHVSMSLFLPGTFVPN